MNVFVHQAIFELAGPAAEEPQFGIGIEAAVTDPAAEEEILARNPEARNAGIRQSATDFIGKCRLDFFVGVERQHPVAAGFLQREVLLRSEAAPRLDVEVGVEGFRNLASAVGRAGVNDDDLVGPGDALQRTREVRLLVQGDDDDG